VEFDTPRLVSEVLGVAEDVFGQSCKRMLRILVSLQFKHEQRRFPNYLCRTTNVGG
jgi:hypothetical protein